MKRPRIVSVAGAAIAFGMLCLTGAAGAQPSADQVLKDFGLSVGEIQRVLQGDYVNVKVTPVSERDLTFGTAFLCTLTPDRLTGEILAGLFADSDPQVRARGELGAPGSLSDLAGLKPTPDETRALSKVEAGDRLNLSTGEIAAFQDVPGGATGAVEQQLQRTLLARYRAYRAYRESGLDGVIPYDRGRGQTTSAASDLREATSGALVLRKHTPALHDVLLGYPKVTLAGLDERFLWVKSVIRGTPTYILSHILVAESGGARAVVRREFFVSAGYNAEQAIAGFLPVEGGTVVVYTSHAFTDQVAGSGGSLKRSIGSRIMADTLKAMFEAGRRRIER